MRIEIMKPPARARMLLLGAALMLQGCSTLHVYYASAKADAEAKRFSELTNEAALYIYRPGISIAGTNSVKLLTFYYLMDTGNQTCDDPPHETAWKSRSFGTTAPKGHRSVSVGPHLSSHCREGRCRTEFGSAVAPKLSAVWEARFESAPCLWPSLPAHPSSEDPFGGYTGARRAGRRLRQRSLDVEAHCGSGEEVVRCSLWCVGDMAVVGRRFALERPETDPARHPARRGSHRPLEALCVASYKKTPGSGAPIWRSWMKAAFCLFPVCGEPGVLRGRRRSCGTATGGIACRLFRRSRSRRATSDWDCMRASTDAISPERKWWIFCADCCGRFAARLTCCGMAARFTGAGVCKSICGLARPG
jgi:hypothetical protein